jgi:SAM-dependent methyltransferase
MLQQLRRWLTDSRLLNVPVDSPELIKIHRQILHEKKCMREVFNEFYDLNIKLNKKHFLINSNNTPIDTNHSKLFVRGKEVELGAGSSIFKLRHPHIVSSDIKREEGVDLVVDAEQMPFGENEIHCFYAINCFHHFADPQKFFNELNRVLQPGGGLIIIDPYFSLFARWFYNVVFKTEHFNMRQFDWQAETQTAQGSEMQRGVMSGANQALSYIVFFRDYERWQKLNPSLEIVEKLVLTNYLRYLLSGGLNFKQLIPDFMLPVVRTLEFLLTPFSRWFALHHVIVIRKKIVR